MFSRLSVHHHNQFQNIFITTKRNPVTSIVAPPHYPLHKSLATSNLLFVSMDLRILDILYKWNQQIYSVLWLDPFTLHNIFEIHLRHSMYWYFIPFHGLILFHCLDHYILFTLLSGGRHLCCFFLLDSVNSAAMNIHVHVFVCVSVFNFGGYILSIGIAGSCCNFMLNFLRNCRIVFWSGCNILYLHQHNMRVLISSHPHQHLLLSVILITAILIGMKY